MRSKKNKTKIAIVNTRENIINLDVVKTPFVKILSTSLHLCKTMLFDDFKNTRQTDRQRHKRTQKPSSSLS
jgi:hypothetical protein